MKFGSKRATSVALQGGGADVIVTDWIWVSRQRAEGRDYAFAPYSLSVGALMVRPDSGIAELADLTGRKVGIAGGPVDKSWLLLQAYAKRGGLDLAAAVEPTFGAPPLLNELMQRGDLPAVLNFWHYNARLKAAGMKELLPAVEILPALGVERPIPLLGWVFNRSWANENRDAVAGFPPGVVLRQAPASGVRRGVEAAGAEDEGVGRGHRGGLARRLPARHPAPVRRGRSGGRSPGLRDHGRRGGREAGGRERYP